MMYLAVSSIVMYLAVMLLSPGLSLHFVSSTKQNKTKASFLFPGKGYLARLTVIQTRFLASSAVLHPPHLKCSTYFSFGEAQILRISPHGFDIICSLQQDSRQGITNKTDGNMNHVTKSTYFPYAFAMLSLLLSPPSFVFHLTFPQFLFFNTPSPSLALNGCNT